MGKQACRGNFVQILNQKTTHYEKNLPTAFSTVQFRG